MTTLTEAAYDVLLARVQELEESRDAWKAKTVARLAQLQAEHGVVDGLSQTTEPASGSTRDGDVSRTAERSTPVADSRLAHTADGQADVEIIDVPDIEGPTAQLCWKQNLTPPNAMARCDRRKGHGGLHVWEYSGKAARLAQCEQDLDAQ